jgi:Rps23 Pro-64 3,4-dihydroxylase Tpa1-like proline 4-hydroxylase
MPIVLCFDCGGTFDVAYGTPNPTKACPKCNQKNTPYKVNGTVIGNNPKDIDRDKTYNEFFETVGDSSNNIKVISNFLSDAQIAYLMQSLPKAKTISFPSQKDNNHEAVNWMHSYMGILDLFKVIDRVKDEVIKAYGFDNVKPKKQTIDVVRWDPGSKLSLHADDLGYITDNHIATLIYLNDDYEGGELVFETHGITIKPKVGDLLIFPGNLNYPHEVKEVVSGTRYTVPIWFSIV